MSIQVVSNESLLAGTPAEKKTEETKPAPVADQAVEQKESAESGTGETEASQEEKEESDDSESQEDAESDDSEKDKPKKKSGSQRRKERAERAEAEVVRLQRIVEGMALKGAEPKNEPKAEPSVNAEGAPKPDDFETHAAWSQALVKWTVDQDRKARDAEDQKSKLRTEQDTLLKSHYDREKSFMGKTADYAETMEAADFLKDASPALQQIIFTSENGPALMYELAKNSAEYDRINQLPPTAAAFEMGRIAAKLPAQTSEAKKPEPKKTTQAPKPIAPVGAKSGPVVKSIEDPNLSQREYETLRREQMKARAVF